MGRQATLFTLPLPLPIPYPTLPYPTRIKQSVISENDHEMLRCRVHHAHTQPSEKMRTVR